MTLHNINMDLYKPLIKRIEALLETDTSPIIIAIDGMCGSGKTTLGQYLHDTFDSNLFHMDDFYLQDHQRTTKRLEEVGGNVDYERFKCEVLIPLESRKDILYRPYDCSSKTTNDKLINFKRLNIIEGSYSQHPYFKDAYVERIFISIARDKQLERIKRRNGEQILNRFIEEWIPKELAYFQHFHIAENSFIIRA